MTEAADKVVNSHEDKITEALKPIEERWRELQTEMLQRGI